jgi:hypothetical protein
VTNGVPVHSWCVADGTPECGGEVRMAREARRKGNGSHVLVGGREKFFSSFYSAGDEIAVRRHANRFAEQATEIMGGHVEARRELLETQGSVDVFFNMVKRTVEFPLRNPRRPAINGVGDRWPTDTAVSSPSPFAPSGLASRRNRGRCRTPEGRHWSARDIPSRPSSPTCERANIPPPRIA